MSAEVTAGRKWEVLVAPGIATLFFCHWNVSGAAPSMTAVSVTGSPIYALAFAG